MIGLGEHSLVVGWAINITAGLVLLGAVFAFVRLARGPSLGDRVVSADAISVLSVALAGVLAVASNRRAFIDVAIALALVTFLATVAFAWYMDQRTPKMYRDEIDNPPGEGR
ncbi:MAG: cation:proton antiporter [Bryobacterales bacterium]|nr:cation:proton antiporter [Bryobacterales bacterium]MDE0627359.1 cation:proton antiporter [Bryobacterales bacterium]